MRKISSIDSRGRIQFVDDKGTGTTLGSKTDCEAYGYDFKNGVCKVPTSKQEVKQADNFTYGRKNIVSGVNNSTLGYNNKINGSNSVCIGNNNTIDVYAENSVTIGTNAYAEHVGEIAFSSSRTPNRAKFSFLQFDGVTTNNTPTEIYLGNNNGARLYINEDYESGFAIDYTAVGINPSSNDIFTSYGHATYKYTNNTLTEVGHEKSTTIRDSSTNHYDIDFAPIVNTPDYIEVKVTGDTGHTVYWTVDFKVTEVRYA